MNVVAILSGIDCKGIPVEALPAGMTIQEAQEIIRAGAAATFLSMMHLRATAMPEALPGSGTDSLRHAFQQVAQPRPDAAAALRKHAEDTGRRVLPPAAEVAKAAVEGQETGAGDWIEAEAEALTQAIAGLTSPEEADRLYDESKRRLSRLQKAAPARHAELWASLQKRKQDFIGAAGAVADIPFISEKRVRACLENLTAFYARSTPAFAEDGLADQSDAELKQMMLNHRVTGDTINRAKVHHPALYRQIVDVLDRGRHVR